MVWSSSSFQGHSSARCPFAGLVLDNGTHPPGKKCHGRRPPEGFSCKNPWGAGENGGVVGVVGLWTLEYFVFPKNLPWEFLANRNRFGFSQLDCFTILFSLRMIGVGFEDMFIDVSQNDDWCCFSTKL